jgi:hypothetical protein
MAYTISEFSKLDLRAGHEFYCGHLSPTPVTPGTICTACSGIAAAKVAPPDPIIQAIEDNSLKSIASKATPKRLARGTKVAVRPKRLVDWKNFAALDGDICIVEEYIESGFPTGFDRPIYMFENRCWAPADGVDVLLSIGTRVIVKPNTYDMCINISSNINLSFVGRIVKIKDIIINVKRGGDEFGCPVSYEINGSWIPPWSVVPIYSVGTRVIETHFNKNAYAGDVGEIVAFNEESACIKDKNGKPIAGYMVKFENYSDVITVPAYGVEEVE